MPMWFVLTQVKNGDSPSSTDTLTLADGRRHGPCSNPSSEQTLSHGFVLETTIRSLTKVHHVAMSTSNHFVSHPFPHLSASPTTYLPPFRFKPMWLWDPRCDKFVQDEWLEGLYKPNGAHVTNCLDNCRDRLKA